MGWGMQCSSRKKALTRLAVFCLGTSALTAGGAISQPAQAACATSSAGSVVTLSCTGNTGTTNSTNSNANNPSTTARTQSFGSDIVVNIPTSVVVLNSGLSVIA